MQTVTTGEGKALVHFKVKVDETQDSEESLAKYKQELATKTAKDVYELFHQSQKPTVPSAIKDKVCRTLVIKK